MNHTRQVLIKNQIHNHEPDPAEHIENLEILPTDEVLDSFRPVKAEHIEHSHLMAVKKMHCEK